MSLLGSLIIRLAADATGVKKGVDEATKDLRKLHSTADETRSVIRKAFAFDIIASQLGTLSGEIGRLQGAWAQTGATAIGVGGRVMQAWGQGGVAGLLVAGLVEPVRALASEFAAVGIEAKRAADDAAEGHKRMAQAIRDENTELNKQLRALEAINRARATGQTEAQAARQMRVEDLGSRFAELSAAAARLERMLNTPGAVDPGARTAVRQSMENTIRQRDLIGEQLKRIGATQMAEEAREALASDRKDKATETPFQRDLRRARESGPGSGTDLWLSRQRAQEDLLAQWDAEEFFEGIEARDAKLAKQLEEEERLRDEAARRLREAAELEAAAREAAGAQFASYLDELAAAGVADRGGSLVDVGGSDGRYYSRDLDGSLYATREQGAALAGDLTGGGALGGVVQGAIAGDPLAVVMSVMQESKQLQGIVAHLNEFIGMAADVFGQMLEPLMPFIKIVTLLGKSVFPMLSTVMDALTPPLRLLFEVVKYVGAVLNVVVSSIDWVISSALDWITETLADFVGWFSEDAEQWLRDLVEGPEKGFVDTVADAWDEFAGLDWDEIIDDMNGLGDAADSVTQSLLNLPAGFRLASARVRATQADDGDVGRATGSTTAAMTMGGGAGGGGGGGITNIFEGDVYVSANDPDELMREVLAVSQFRRVGTTGDRYQRAPSFVTLEDAPA